ncbi:MAG: hypothetical protein QGH39_09935 [Candidatus Thermoplasmatota archaeon]|jgi:hypothetical protein|nr:hypothetical protein [Candidatus Thermoplasmatota archaeon]MDP7265861.1 hypothetical protein [Candidatus Thermoplasmatota archaeon]
MATEKILGMEMTDILMLIGILFVFILISYVIIQAIIRRNTIRTRIRLEEIENEKMKMNMLFKKKLREELKDAGLFLSKKEMDHVDSIKLDNSILSRKILYKMTEMDQKTQRLELGVNKAKLEGKLDEIEDYEKKLFT